MKGIFNFGKIFPKAFLVYILLVQYHRVNEWLLIQQQPAKMVTAITEDIDALNKTSDPCEELVCFPYNRVAVVWVG